MHYETFTKLPNLKEGFEWLPVLSAADKWGTGKDAIYHRIKTNELKAAYYQNLLHVMYSDSIKITTRCKKNIDYVKKVDRLPLTKEGFEWLLVIDAAARWKVWGQTIRYRIRNGLLPGVKYNKKLYVLYSKDIILNIEPHKKRGLEVRKNKPGKEKVRYCKACGEPIIGPNWLFCYTCHNSIKKETEDYDLTGELLYY